MEDALDSVAIAGAVAAGDIRLSTRLMTLAENGDARIEPVLEILSAQTSPAQVIGITGPPGSGKSTLVDRMIETWRRRGKTVAVLAVDPSSPFSGGALLGDRVRMARHSTDAGVFIRSISARGALGGLAKTAGDVLTVMGAMGWDVVLIETVGVGQSEIDIASHAQCVVLVQTGEGGDNVQASKAGILEIATIFAVTKSDLATAGQMVRHLRDMLAFRRDHENAAWEPPVITCKAIAGGNIDTLIDAISNWFAHRADHPALAARDNVRRLRRRTMDIALQRLAATAGRTLESRMAAGESNPYALAAGLIRDMQED